jgi:hypothetical protein
VLEGEHAAQQDGDLTGEDEADERRSLERGDQEYDGQCNPAVQGEDAVGEVSHAGATSSPGPPTLETALPGSRAAACLKRSP